MNRILCLPLDDRPVNYDYPAMLGKIAGVQVSLPPREWLGNPWRAARRERLADWLRAAAAGAQALIVAAETLAYGGLIPSRTSPDSFEQAAGRLELLRELKAANPQRPLYVSSVIQRISRADSAEEERPYWAEYGSRMFRLSCLEHKSALGEASQQELDEREALRAAIPGRVYADYAAIRARNHRINRHLLELARERVLDYLLLPQDDTAAYGWNIAEARALQALIRRQGLTERAITYPGADEIGCLMLARALSFPAFSPRVYPRFSSSVAPGLVTAYEDRPMLELLKAHLAPLGGTLALSPQEADFLLFINAPALGQGVGEYQWAAQFGKEELAARLPSHLRDYLDKLFVDEHFKATRREMHSPLRSPEEFVRAVGAALKSGKNVAVADVAFVNGADLILGAQLKPLIPGLAAYAGWNTAGNTLGTALAQAVIYSLAQRAGPSGEQMQAQLEFLFLRFLDDYYYQAIVRSQSMLEDLPRFGLPPGEERLPEGEAAAQIEERVAARLTVQARRLEETFQASGLAAGVRVEQIHLPWQRLFEIGCRVSVQLAEERISEVP